MMKNITHKDRVERVRNYSSKNKLFIIIAIILLIFLFSGMLRHINPETQQPDNSEVSVESETDAETDNTPHWRFYWSDFGIFVVCVSAYTVIKVRNAKKAREKLQ